MADRLLAKGVLLHLAARGWHLHALEVVGLWEALALSLVAALGLRWPRRALIGVLPLLGLQALTGFPLLPNHFYLEVLGVLLLLAGAGELLPRMAGIVLFSSGLQKVLYGTWWDGSFLSWAVAHDPRFALLAGLPLVPIGAAVVLVEIGLPLGLLWSRARTVVTGLCILLVLGMQGLAREWFFGLLMALFLSRFIRTPPLPILAAIYGLLTLGAVLGWSFN